MRCVYYDEKGTIERNSTCGRYIIGGGENGGRTNKREEGGTSKIEYILDCVPEEDDSRLSVPRFACRR